MTAAVATMALAGAGLVSSAPAAKRPKAPYALRVVAKRLAAPLYVTAPSGAPGRLYVVLRRGVVRVIANGRLERQPFLDIHDQVSTDGERGLLSIAFAPDYATSGRVYAVFTDKGSENSLRLVEYRAVDDRVDPASARLLVRVPHDDSPYHNGGQLAFGPDGALYMSVGDGGYETDDRGRLTPDPHGNAQNLDVLLGKIFRLDTGAAQPRPEIVAYGLRNAWRFSFDAASGDMIIGDVGWMHEEEVDVLPRGAGLTNFGWSVYEGRRRGPTTALNPAGTLVGPALAYANGPKGNCAITGGYVYRGRAVPRLTGRYLFGDYCSGRI